MTSRARSRGYLAFTLSPSSTRRLSVPQPHGESNRKVAETLVVGSLRFFKIMAAGAPAGSRPTSGGNKRPDDVANQNAGKKNARQIESCWWRQAPFDEFLHGHGQAD
jgi:hypothetical protein